MPTRLADIQPDELSLVQRGANRRPFTVRKAAETLPAELLDLLDLPAEGESAFLKQLVEADVEAEQGRAVLAAYRLLKAHEDVLPEPIQKAVAAMAADADTGDERAEDEAGTETGADTRATDSPPDSSNVSKEDPQMTETAQAVPVKKEDGTWDLSSVPEEQHEFLTELLAKADRAETVEAEKVELEKTAAAAQKGEEDALEIVKAERDIRLTGVYVAKAAELGESEEFGSVLKSIAAAVDETTFASLEAVLKANHERAETAGLYQEIGKSGQGGGSDAQTEFDVKVDEVRKAEGSLSREQAYTKAMREHPDLYARTQEA